MDLIFLLLILGYFPIETWVIMISLALILVILLDILDKSLFEVPFVVF